MIRLSDEAKRKFARFVGPDGKLIIDDSVPIELRETFQYFNDKGINILEMNIDDEIEVLDEPDASDDNFNSSAVDNDYDSSSEFSSTIIEDNSEVDLDGLNDLFS